MRRLNLGGLDLSLSQFLSDLLLLVGKLRAQIVVTGLKSINLSIDSVLERRQLGGETLDQVTHLREHWVWARRGDACGGLVGLVQRGLGQRAPVHGLAIWLRVEIHIVLRGSSGNMVSRWSVHNLWLLNSVGVSILSSNHRWWLIVNVTIVFARRLLRVIKFTV